MQCVCDFKSWASWLVLLAVTSSVCKRNDVQARLSWPWYAAIQWMSFITADSQSLLQLLNGAYDCQRSLCPCSSTAGSCRYAL